MATKQKNINIPDDLVVFEDPDGNIVSNDPRYRALQTLGLLDGVSFGESQPKDANKRMAAAAGVPEDNDEEIDDDDDDESDDVETYEDIKGKELATLAKERGVELKTEDGGKKTAGAIRAELIAQDAENTEEDSEE